LKLTKYCSTGSNSDNIFFSLFRSDNKNNDRYKSNSKSVKRHATTPASSTSMPPSTKSENKRDNVMMMMSEMSSTNETKHHVNFNKRAQKNQYPPDSMPSFSYLRSSSSSSTAAKYHHVPSATITQQQQHHGHNHNANIINSNNSPYANSVLTEAVEQPTLMELECIAGYDGGLPQYFFLEAYDSRTRKLRLNITSALNDVPLFRIDLAGMRAKIFPFHPSHHSHALTHLFSLSLVYCTTDDY
jgi:hypothetical protein